MIKLTTWVNKDCTLGRLSYGNFKCFTLELPWKDNATNVSCVPAGTYKATKYNSPSKGLVVLLKDVEGRTWIEIHSGNYTHQIRGCILVGDGITYLDNDSIPDVVNSRNTLYKLLEALPMDFDIKIDRV